MVETRDISQHRSILGAFDDVNSAAIRVHQDRCAKVRNRNVACLKCADVCTSGCISMRNGVLAVDASRCVGCGTCATVCPTCALEARNPSDAQLLRRCLDARVGDVVSLGCEHVVRALADMADTSRIASVVCVGRVEESLVCALAALGVRSVRIVCGECSCCEQAHGLDTANEVAQSANAILRSWGSDACVTVAKEAPAAILAEGISPQDTQAAIEGYFSIKRACSPLRTQTAEVSDAQSHALNDVAHPSDEGAGVASSSQEKPIVSNPAIEAPAFAFAPRPEVPKPQPGIVRCMKDGTLPHFMPDRRERLLESLSKLGSPQVDMISSRLWGCVVIDGTKCSSCRMCATFCPTGAIRKFDYADGTFGVEHAPADCVKCGSCRDICPEGAIRILDDVRSSYLLEGRVHSYKMKPRAVQLGSAQQIVETMRTRMPGTNLFER